LREKWKSKLIYNDVGKRDRGKLCVEYMKMKEVEGNWKVVIRWESDDLRTRR
jgi:hypothetical protein